jgi:hypothetical protein
MTLLVYTINFLVKYKYPIQDMMSFFKNVDLKRPNFKVDIEDVCNEKQKELFKFMIPNEEKKDRANTFTGMYDFKTCFNGDRKMSVNNPLSELSKFK